MQYHFHLISNILKLPCCFPLEIPSSNKSDKIIEHSYIATSANISLGMCISSTADGKRIDKCL